MQTALKLVSQTLAATKLFPTNGNVTCDTVEPLATPFDAEAYMGTWYDIQHSTGAAFQPDYFDCTLAKYSDLNLEAGTFTVSNTSTVKFFPRAGVTGTATVAGQPNGQAIVSFFGQKFDQPNYKVLDTDYETYSLVYSCEENDMAFLWILSRTPTLEKSVFDRLNAEAATLLPNYDFSKAVLSKQGDKCKY